jgi:NitT/TauT family transport system permease protein
MRFCRHGRAGVWLSLALAVACASPAQAQSLEKVSIVVFSPPSLGAFMPPVIKARKLDQANGLDIAFHERTPDAYTAQFNSGEFKVGGSASLMTIALGATRGVKVRYLFNLFDFWGAVVTSRPEVKTLKDLEGRQLAGARATTNYVMFEFFAKKLGVDTGKIQVVNTATPGLVSYALADRADAVQLWEPAYTLLMAKKPSIRTLDLAMEQTWKSFAGGSRLPYLGVGARLGRPESGSRCQALCRLQGRGRMDPQESRRGCAAGGAGRFGRRPQGHGVVDPQQRAARHQPRGGGRGAPRDRGRLPRGRRSRLFPLASLRRHHPRQAHPMIRSPRVARVLQATASTLVLAGLWQIASLFFPHYLFPPLLDVVKRVVDIVISGPLLTEVLVTAARIFAGLAGAFLLGAVVALLIGRSPFIESYVTPVLVFLQGIPALSWVVIAIIWFHGIEFRIFFIMVLTTLPAFTFQILDAFRSMSKDLFEMTMAFRPRTWTLFRVLIVPTIVPGILTAWKVNIGNAARVVVVAELVGATGGVGYQLLRQQQLFDMAGAIAWTLQLVLFVLVVQQAIVAIEGFVLRYRAVSERAM